MSDHLFIRSSDLENRPNSRPQSPLTDSTPSTQSTAVPGPSSDPASSLRAAALLTLKSKRRKPTISDQSSSSSVLLSRPPPPVDTLFQLDYGQEDIASSPPAASHVPAPAPPPASSDTSLKVAVPDVEDSQTREEGEISDSEGTPPQQPLSSLPTNSLLSTLDTNSASSTKGSPPPRPVVPKLESPTTQPLLDRISDPPLPGSGLSAAIPSLDVSLISSALSQLDDDHVRPGLAMNQAQYNTAKDLVLDLLGWAVPPEYLVDCGLSREIVYYVFTELNLHLPSNLDITGLIPYPPIPQMLDLAFEVPQDAVATAHSVVPSLPARPEIVTSGAASQRPLHGHPSLPAKPLIVGTTKSSPSQHSVSSPTTPPTPVTPGPTQDPPMTPSNGSLHDMERQRRQELLARKAVQASRKPKASDHAPTSATTTSSMGSSFVSPTESTLVQASLNDMEVDDSEPQVPTEAVEDFLKSIGPVPGTENEKGSEQESGGNEILDVEAARHSSPDGMDVDDIPGLGAPQSGNEGGTSHLSSHSSLGSLSSASTSYADLNHNQSQPSQGIQSAHDSPPSSNEAQHAPSSSDSTTTTFDQSAGYKGASAGELTQLRGPPLQRRGTKRPVAADFVDFESGSRGNGYTNGGPSHNPNYLTRRKTGNGNGSGGSFASVSGMRRCVIDLSDSEGEGLGVGEDEYDGEYSREREYEKEAVREREGWGRGTGGGGRYSPGLGRFASHSASSFGAAQGSGSGWATPTYPGSSNGTVGVGTGIGTSGRMSPAALMEKELEIRRMRQMIAQREESRLKKLAAMSRSMASIPDTADLTSSSTDPAPSVMTDVPIPVKQEDPDDSAPSLNGKGSSSNTYHKNSHHTSPPPPPVQEDVVPEEPVLTDSTKFRISAASASASASTSASATPPIDDDTDAPIANNRHTNSTEHSTGESVLTAEARQEQVVRSSTLADTEDRRQHLEEREEEQVDVDLASSSSTQTQPSSQAHPKPEENQELAHSQQDQHDYATYDSPFELYPLLRSRLRPMLLGDSSTSAQESTSLTGFASSSFSSASTSSHPSSSSSLSSFPSLSSVISSASSYSTLPTRTYNFPVPDLKPLKLATTVKLLDPSKRICQYEVPGGGVCRDEGCEDVHLGRIGFPSAGDGTGSGVEPSDEDTAQYLYSALPAGWREQHGVSVGRISGALQDLRRQHTNKMVFEERVAQALAALGAPLPPPSPT